MDVTLLANFTHQIINPLNGVLGTLDNILDGTVEEDRRPQRLRAVYSQLAFTIEMVRNLAWLSQVSTPAGREALSISKGGIVLPKVIIDAAQFYQEFGERRGIRIRLTDRETQYTALGHSPLLLQLFMNLFENGIKYGDANSKVTVECRPQKKTGNLLVEVTSYGEGFLPDEAERIFDIGFRGRHAKRISASGSGLGLYICRQIMTLHDGTIVAEYSPPTRQAVFRMRFPSYSIGPERNKEI